MGQNEIYQFLKKHRKKWFTSKQIAESLNVGPSSVSTALKRLRKHKQVFYKQSPQKVSTFLYMVK